MTDASERSQRRAIAVLLAALVLVLAVAGAVAAWATLDDSDRQLTPRQVTGIEFSLHEIGRVCVAQAGKRRTAADARTLARIARSFVRFYRAYPDARFQIDDESGRMLSVLLVARVELRTCSPQAASIVDRALPARFRAAG